MNKTNYKKYVKPKKRRLGLKILLLVTLSAFLVVVAYAVTLKIKAENAIDRAHEVIPDRQKSNLRDAKVKLSNNNISILFIGVDDSMERNQGDAHSRSDALILATLNPIKKTVKLVSIPRDSYVYIPEVGYKDKITHAHAFGGTRATIEAVEGLLDIPVDYYVKMNFNAFIDIVDAVGGIEVDVPYERLEMDENDNYTIQLKRGMQKLDGRHALALARTRKMDNDVERGKRQQIILEAIVNETVSLKALTKYGDVIDAVGDNMKTDMTYKEMTSFIDYVKDGMPQIDALNLNGSDDMSTGVYYYKLEASSLDEVKHILKNHLNIMTNSSKLTERSSKTDEHATSATKVKTTNN